MMHSGRQSHVQTLHRLAKEVGGSGEVELTGVRIIPSL